MLVCSVSQLRRRAAIAADIAESAAAVDAPGTGNVVFAALVDDPASVGDHVDAFLGQIMREAANASATVNAGLTYAASIVEAVTAADHASGSMPTVWSAAVVEAATAASAQDAAALAATARTATVAGMEPVIVTTGTPRTSRLRSGVALTAR
jgi:hypothetical protein